MGTTMADDVGTAELDGRRISIVDAPEGIYVGGVLVADRNHLGQLVRLLSAMYEHRWFR